MLLRTQGTTRNYGVNLQEFIDYPQRQEAALQRAQRLGVSMVRLQISWSDVERVRGTYDFSKHDRVMSLVRKYGFQVLVDVGTTPEGYRPAGTPNTFGPTTLTARTAFARYCRALATRYRGQVMAYEVWNEANSAAFWSPTPSVSAYAELFSMAYDQLKAGDPGAAVVTSGLAGGGAASTIDALQWSQEFLATPAAAKMDGYGFHPYSNGSGAVDGMLLLAAHVQQLLVRRGYGYVPLYCTETGISTYSVSPERQAEVIETTARFLESLPGVHCVLWYVLDDFLQEPAGMPNEGYFGLFDKWGQEKPAAARVRAAARRAVPAGEYPVEGYALQGGVVRTLTEV